jgi:serine/threonine protein kinase
VMGTAGYMSPEQALGQAVDPRADMYAFGVVLYEIISGRLPYAANEAAQILAKQLTEPPAPLPDATPPALSALIHKLLEKAPDARVQTAKELSNEVARIRSSPESAGPSTVLDVDSGGLPKSARTGRSTDDSAATLDVAEGQKGPDSAPSWRNRTGTRVAGGVLLATLLGAAVFWGTRKGGEATQPFTLSSATAALLSSLPPLPVGVPSASESPVEDEKAPAARQEGPGTTPTSSATTHTTFSETKTTKTDGNTTTTKHTSRRSTVTEKKTVEQKRRTGPGGIYIPPPREWFK